MFFSFFSILCLSDTNVTYKIDENSVLQIGGNGNITSQDLIEQTEERPFTSVNITGNIEAILEGSFNDNEDIQKVYFNKELRVIERHSFASCVSLSELVFPTDSNIQYIDSYSFQNTALKSVVFPKSLKVIKSNVFVSCTKLETIDFLGTPENFTITFISNCPLIKRIKFPDDSQLYKSTENAIYTKDESILMRAMPVVTDFVIPDSVHIIHSYAFQSCKISNLLIPTNVVEIGDFAFANMPNLNEMIIPSNVKVVKASVFFNSPQIAKIIMNCDIETIQPFFAYGCAKLSEVKLPDNLKTIRLSAFHRCTGLKSISFPESLKMLDQNTFKSSGLETLVLPKQMSGIGASSFAKCNSLVSVVMPETIDAIGIELFGECSKLESAILPLNVRRVSERCFFKTALKEIVIPNEVLYVEKESFAYTTKLRKVKFGANVTKISYRAFAFSGIGYVDFNEKLGKLSDSVFDMCENLKSVEFHSQLTSIGRNAFNSTGLTSLKIVGSPTINPFAFSNTMQLKTVSFGKMTKLYRYVFYSSGIETLTIPQYLTEIQYCTFKNCSNLKKVVINGDIRLDNMSFANCDKLKTFEVMGDIKKISNETFIGSTLVDSLLYCGKQVVKTPVLNVKQVTVGTNYGSKTFGGINVIVNGPVCGLPEVIDDSFFDKTTIIVVSTISAVGIIVIITSIIICSYMSKKHKSRDYLSESLLVKV